MSNADSTETKILTAARELFMEKGYHDTSMSAIANRAGLGKGTLYWHFDSKDELFKKMITREGKVVLEELKKLSEDDLPVEVILKEFIKIRIKRTAKHRQSSQIFMDKDNFANKEFKKTMFEIYFSIVEELEKIIIRGNQEGIFKIEKPNKTAAAIMGTINGLCSAIFTDKDQDFNLEENVDLIYDLIMDGIRKREV